MHSRMNAIRSREALFSGKNKNSTGSNAHHIEQSQNLLEEQNNEQINHLSLQINTLKELTKNIHAEVIEQNKFIDRAGGDFDNTQGLLGGTLKKMGIMMESGGSKHMCYLITFVVFVFILIYYVIRGV